MFESLLERLDEDVQVVKNVLTLHDELRSQFYRPVTPEADLWTSVRAADPTKLAWQIYDHCAAFTRLYSVYEQFVEELASEYLLLLPELYKTYDQLPETVLKQHRLGIGQILLKLGKDGPYRHLEEAVIVTDFSQGVRGEKKYKLLGEAFFVDRQNYRLDIIQRLFGSLGFDQIGRKISNSITLTTFLAVERSGAQTVEGELADFVRYRNEAAHTEVTNVVSTNEIKSKADFILLFCRVLADLVKEELYRRKQELGQFHALGTISEVFLKGMFAVVRLTNTRLELQEELVISYPGPKNHFIAAKIASLQFNGVNCTALTTRGMQEIGVGFGEKIRLGGELRRIVQTSPEAMQNEIHVDANDSLSVVESDGELLESLVDHEDENRSSDG